MRMATKVYFGMHWMQDLNPEVNLTWLFTAAN
jgi:hypothetical protein